MENASKALLIAGGVLIAILVLSLIVFGYRQIVSYQNTKAAVTQNEQLAQFNKRFEAYNKSVVKGYELVSLGNLANDTNTTYSETEGYTKIKVWVNLQAPTGQLPGGTGIQKIKNGTTIKYYDLLEYLSKDFNADYTTAANRKEFKDLYFDCVDVVYDSKSSRITTLYYNQIVRVN